MRQLTRGPTRNPLCFSGTPRRGRPSSSVTKQGNTVASSSWTRACAHIPAPSNRFSSLMAHPQLAAAKNSSTSAPPAGPLHAASVSDLRQARVVVFSIPPCPYCKRAKEALTNADIPYVDVNVGHDDALRQLVRDLTGKRTVPQIFLAGRSVGGSDDLLAMMADGRFTRELAEAAEAAEVAVPPNLADEIEAAQLRAEAEAAAEAKAADTAAAAASKHLEQLAARLRRPAAEGGIARGEHTAGGRAFTAFSLRALLDWLAAAGEADPRVTATRLLDAHVLAPATLDRAEAVRAAAAVSAEGGKAPECPATAGAVLLMLATEAPPPKQGEALNMQFIWQGPGRPANEVANGLRQLILELYDKNLSADGRSVSYGAIRSDPRFADFVAATAELQKVDLSPLSREELIAFGINLYNALVIHALVALGLTRMTAAQRTTFYSRTAKYNIGGLDYSADDIENGVLRGNRAAASNLFNLVGLHGLAGGLWRQGDPRLSKVVSPVDPRIHFALVCGAKSCPPIKLYTAANLEEGLAAAAEAFCSGEVTVDKAKREVKLSKIFKWYAVDFGANKYDRLSYISGFLAEPAKSELQEMVGDAKAGRGHVSVQYKEYDWSLNGTD